MEQLVFVALNLAKVVTGLASGVSHWRFGNVDRRLVLQLAVPGSIGAVIGVTVLANVQANRLRPLLAVVLLVIGLRMLVRFSKRLPSPPGGNAERKGAALEIAPSFDERGLTVAATAGGITNGMVGAWGPVVTPFLLQRGLAPRFAVGSVNTAEVAVATVAAGSLVASVGRTNLDPGIVVAMIGGGVIAAPLAAWVIRFIPIRAMGLSVAGLLLLTNVRDLTQWANLETSRWLVYVLATLAVGLAAIRPRWQTRQAG
jgi:uncharacterized membrane protein YfcA